MSGLIRTCCLAVILFAVFVWAPGVSLPLAQAVDETPTPERLKAAAAAATPVVITPKIVSSFQVPGNRALAITWANDSLWLADANKDVYRLNVNGEVQTSFPITFTPHGLAWDETNLWSGDDALSYGSWRAFQLNETGRVVGALTDDWGVSNIQSLAWVGNLLYLSDNGPGDIHVVDKTGKHLRSWKPDFVGYPKGMTYDGTGLWIGKTCYGDGVDQNSLYRYTLLGQRLNSIDLNAIGITCTYLTQNTRGLAWDGRFLWYTGDDIFKVYKLDVGVPDIALSATALNFGTQPLQSTSAQTLTVQNTGGTNIPIHTLTVSGDYAFTTTCPTGSTLAAGASCTIRVNFTPSSVGTRSGVLTLTHYADVRPNLVSLTGTGVTPNYTLLPGSLNFGEQAVGSSSTAKSVTLQNTSSSPLPVSAITSSGEYNQTHNCPTTLAAGTSCTIFVTFAPQANGVRNGTLTVTLHPTLSPSSVTLTGMGINGPTSTPTPTVTVTPTVTPEPAVTVTPTSTVTPLLKSWTLLIYAVGDNDLGAYMDVRLKGSLLDRLRSAGSQSQVNLAVLYDGPGANDTVRYILSADGNWNPFQLPEAQMDTPAELRQFIEWGFDTFRSAHYYLSIVDHASGVLGMGVDRTTDSAGLAYLTPAEIREAITLGTGTGAHKFDVVHFDGCSFGLFENTSIVQDLADYVVASPNTGWGVFAYADYRRLAGQAPNDPRSFAQAVARQYGAAVKQEGYPYTISVFDMAKYDEVRTKVGVLGSRLASFVQIDKDTRRALLRQKRQEMQKYDSDDYQITDEDRYVDLRSMAATLQALNVMTITNAANDVLGATQAFIVHAEHVAGTATIFSQTITMDLTGAQGLSIFYPPSTFSSPGAYQRYVGNKLFPNLTTNWTWLDFLRDGVPPIGEGQPIPPEHEPLLAVLLPAAPPPPLTQLFLPVIARQ